MMKRKHIAAVATGLALSGIVLFVALGFNAGRHGHYVPPSPDQLAEISGGEEFDFKGAAEWQFNRIKNQVTGDIDLDEMAAVQARAIQTMNNARNNSSAQTTSAQWNEIGPDNVGGRTRALLIDNANSQHMFAGGVSGGLWESFDGANNWQRCAGFFSLPGVNINVVSIAQTSTGTLYVGTGETTLYAAAASGTGYGGFIGGGIYKSYDHGVSWQLLTSTVPASQSTSIIWASVNKIAISASDTNTIFASTNRGFRVSNNGGQTWVVPSGIVSANVSTDVAVGSDGRVVAIISGKPYLSLDNGVSFTNVGTSAQGFLSAAAGRTAIAIAPTNPNYVYAIVSQASGVLQGLWISVDGAQNWTQVTGAGNSQFDPIVQGTYDLAITVDPTNANRAIIGGVQLWEWMMLSNNPPSGQWTRIALEFPDSPFNPFYVHSDKHAIVFHPTQAGTFFVGSDGGIGRTLNNGQTYQQMNAGYNVTQCYSIAHDHQTYSRNVSMAGSQDNGTQFVDGTGNTPMSAIEVSGGDGGLCEMSFLNPNALFATVYYGTVARSNNRGNSMAQFYSTDDTRLTNAGNAFYASFVTPIRLWESLNDQLSSDTVTLINNTTVQNIMITVGGQATFTGNLATTTTTVPAPTYLLNTLIFVCGSDTLFSNGAGTITGDGTGTVSSGGAYSITFNNAPIANLSLKAIFDVQYGAGTVFTLNSNVQGRGLTYTSVVTVDPGDTIKVQDVIQSRLAVGFSAANGLWLIRHAIDFSTTPEWIKIAGSAHSAPDVMNGEISCMAWSPNGDDLYVGMGGNGATGNVYRISNIAAVLDSANGDISAASIANPNCVVTCTRIGNFGSTRSVTGLDVDPNNPDNLIVTLGNYGNTAYVYLCQNASTAPSSSNTSNFTNKTGTLVADGGVPVYCAAFDKYVSGRVLIGTEYGVLETTTISGTPNWQPAMGGLDNVAVDAIRQQHWEPWLVPNAGCFYIGTHGRGMWRDDSSWQQPTGISNPSPVVNNANGLNTDLTIFPNPVADHSNIRFVLDKGGIANVRIYDLSGKLVFDRVYEGLNSGTNTVEFPADNLVKGTYIVTVTQGLKKVGTGRFVKVD